MKITLNLDNDYELQTFAKDLVRGQITSVIRDEIRTIINEEITRKSKYIDERNITTIIKDEIRNVITRYIKQDMLFTSIKDDYIVPILKKEIDKVMSNTDYTSIIEREMKYLIKEEVRKIIQNLTEISND